MIAAGGALDKLPGLRLHDGKNVRSVVGSLITRSVAAVVKYERKKEEAYNFYEGIIHLEPDITESNRKENTRYLQLPQDRDNVGINAKGNAVEYRTKE